MLDMALNDKMVTKGKERIEYFIQNCRLRTEVQFNTPQTEIRAQVNSFKLFGLK